MNEFAFEGRSVVSVRFEVRLSAKDAEGGLAILMVRGTMVFPWNIQENVVEPHVVVFPGWENVRLPVACIVVDGEGEVAVDVWLVDEDGVEGGSGDSLESLSGPLFAASIPARQSMMRTVVFAISSDLGSGASASMLCDEENRTTYGRANEGP